MCGKALDYAADRGDRAMPKRPKVQGEVQTISFRTRADLKLQLEATAAKNGRSLAQEAERRLEASFTEGEVSDIATPTGVIAQSIRNSIDIIQSQLKCNWWETGNSATIFEGVLKEIAERLVRPFPDQKLYSNKIMKDTEADDDKLQQELRSRYLADGAAIARLATQEAFDRRDAEYPRPQVELPRRQTRLRKPAAE